METTKTTSLVPTMIIATFVLFALFIGSMVYRASQSDINLVRDDYYEQTLHQNDHMATVARTESANIALQFQKESGDVVLQLPDDLQADATGMIHFYRPSNGQLDFTIPLALENGTQKLNTSELEKGKWNVKVTFTSNQHSYYKETAFIL